VSRIATDWAFSLQLPGMQKLVLLALANRHNSETGRCDPSLSRLARDCGLSKGAVLRALTSLAERGVVQQERRKAGSMFTSSSYFLQIGVVLEKNNVVPEENNPLVTQMGNGSASEGQEVVPQQDINQEVKPVREPKEAIALKLRQKLTVKLPDTVPAEQWQDYVAMREEKRKPLGATAAKLLLRKLESLEAEGHDSALLLIKATERQWLTVYPGDDTKAPPPKPEYVELTPEQAAAMWRRDFGRVAVA
jgi:Helix-turn-helix domain